MQPSGLAAVLGSDVNGVDRGHNFMQERHWSGSRGDWRQVITPRHQPHPAGGELLDQLPVLNGHVLVVQMGGPMCSLRTKLYA